MVSGYVQVYNLRFSLISLMTSRIKRQKYDIGLPNDHLSSNDMLQNKSCCLVPFNQDMEKACECMFNGTDLPNLFLPESMWEEWLWGSDPTEPCHIDCLMNRSHLIGLLLVRYRAIYQEKFKTSSNNIVDFLGVKNNLSLFDEPVNQYNLRQLRDAVQNIQLNWVKSGCVEIGGT